MKNADTAAMPTQSNGGDIFGGLTKREMMAMSAMQGLLAAPDLNNVAHRAVALTAIAYADALLSELEQQTCQKT